jgi:hypothetical protein
MEAGGLLKVREQACPRVCAGREEEVPMRAPEGFVELGDELCARGGRVPVLLRGGHRLERVLETRVRIRLALVPPAERIREELRETGHGERERIGESEEKSGRRLWSWADSRGGCARLTRVLLRDVDVCLGTGVILHSNVSHFTGF